MKTPRPSQNTSSDRPLAETSLIAFDKGSLAFFENPDKLAEKTLKVHLTTEKVHQTIDDLKAKTRDLVDGTLKLCQEIPTERKVSQKGRSLFQKILDPQDKAVNLAGITVCAAIGAASWGPMLHVVNMPTAAAVATGTGAAIAASAALALVHHMIKTCQTARIFDPNKKSREKNSPTPEIKIN